MRLFTMETRSLGEDPPSRAFMAFETGNYTETDADFRSVIYFDLDKQGLSLRSASSRSQQENLGRNGNVSPDFDARNGKHSTTPKDLEKVGYSSHTPEQSTSTPVQDKHTPVQATLLAEEVELQPVQYSETMTLAAVPNYQERYVSTWVDVRNKKGYHEKVDFEPILAPVRYSTSIICYPNSTRRRYLSHVEYEPRVRPQKYSEAMYIFPKTAETTFVSVLNYHVDECRRWFKSSVELKAKTYTTSRIQPEKRDVPRYSVTKTVFKQQRGAQKLNGCAQNGLTNGPTDSYGRLLDKNMNENGFLGQEDCVC